MPAQEKVFRNAGWLIKTVHGPIMGDKEGDAFRRYLSAIVLPEMVFHLNRVELVHEASGVVISLNAFDALAGWRHEDLPPLQVRVAEEWRKAREHEIAQQNAVQLTYDWTFTTPYTCTVVPPPSPASQQSASPSTTGSASSTTSSDAAAAAAPPSTSSAASSSASAAPSEGGKEGEAAGGLSLQALRHHPRGVADFVCDTPAGTAAASAAPGAPHPSQATGTAHPPPPQPPSHPAAAAAAATAAAAAAEPVPACVWQPTSEQIDRGLLMERDPILFYDEVPLYESDLDDNGVCAVTAKLRVMPRCWLVLLRCWVRVDGSLVRLRESRLFCSCFFPTCLHCALDTATRYRHDMRSKALDVLQEVRYCEGGFKDLRRAGAPDEGPAYTDADAAAQVFQAVAPVGLKTLQLRKMTLPQPQQPSQPSLQAAIATPTTTTMKPPPLS